MSQYSDSESQDSEDGIRYKTDTTRFKNLSSSNRRRSSPKRSAAGPDLPPHLRKRGEKKAESSVGPQVLKSSPKSSSVGPELRPHVRKREEKQEDRVGPQLPPHLLKSSPKRTVRAEPPPHLTKQEKKDVYVGPQLPPHLSNKQTDLQTDYQDKEVSPSYIGPQLPPHLLQKQDDSPDESQSEHEDLEDAPLRIGPQLPPHLLKKQTPPDSSEAKDSSYFGPQLPPHLKKVDPEPVEEDSDDEDYGPLPAGSSTSSPAQLALEERALQLKLDQLDPGQNQAPVREEWMLELPTVKASNFGLGPRQFRSKAGPDMSDRSSWTDTPEDKKKPKSQKVDLKKEAEVKEIRNRDEEQEKISKKLKRKKESLLEIHQTKMKHKKKDEGPAERRPFSRELDLQVNRFDEAQKKAVLKKAQLLDDRFSRGQSKFL